MKVTWCDVSVQWKMRWNQQLRLWWTAMSLCEQYSITSLSLSFSVLASHTHKRNDESMKQRRLLRHMSRRAGKCFTCVPNCRAVSACLSAASPSNNVLILASWLPDYCTQYIQKEPVGTFFSLLSSAEKNWPALCWDVDYFRGLSPS